MRESTGIIVDAMKSTPLALALLVVNVCFIGFTAYTLKQIGSNANERDKAHTELVNNLVRNCQQKG